MWSCHPVCARNGTNPWICACKGWHGIACRYDDVPRSKIEQLTYGEIMVLSVFRVEHAIVVVEFYAIVFPLCKYISTPKSDRKSHWLWTISNHPTKIALILNSDNQKLWRKIEGLPDRAPEIIKVASIPLRVYIACIPFDFIVIKWQIDICVARFNLSSCSIASNYCFSIYKWRPYKCSG